MKPRQAIRRTLSWSASAIAAATAAYAGYVAVSWCRYGHPSSSPDEADPLLDKFIPAYDVAERHHIRVAAPADVTFAAACEQDLMALPAVRALFKARELVLGAEPDRGPRPEGLIAATKSIGWGVLAEVPGREIVMGAVTQPWCADVVFRAVPPAEFAAFNERDYVKIVWTLRADSTGPSDSIFRTETRVVTTDAAARSKFRWYWAKFSPGIKLIRWLSLRPVRRNAEARVARHAATSDAQKQFHSP